MKFKFWLEIRIGTKIHIKTRNSHQSSKFTTKPRNLKHIYHLVDINISSFIIKKTKNTKPIGNLHLISMTNMRLAKMEWMVSMIHERMTK
jgi:hypothetical protein